MDDNAKNATSYQFDQEILDARGIDITVDEVTGLSTTKFSERIRSLHLTDGDRAFLKGLRRRIKNRLASQNSRRRSMEHLRKLTRELRAVRACRDNALAERKTLVLQREQMRARCKTLRDLVVQTLRARLDHTEVPSIDIVTNEKPSESQKPSKDKLIKDEKCDIDIQDTEMFDCRLANLKQETCEIEQEIYECRIKNIDTEQGDLEEEIFECRIEKLVQKSVNHIYNKKVFAKTVFIENDRNMSFYSPELKNGEKDDAGVLNLSVKSDARRKSHGRKQSAPKRIAYVDYDVSDCVLDLKIKKEPQ